MNDKEIKNLSELEREKSLKENEIDVKNLVIESMRLPNIRHVVFQADPITGEITFFEMKTHEPPPRQVISWMKIAGFFFTALTIITLSLLMVGVLHGIDKSIYFNVWVAVCIAASTGFLGGDANATGRLPMPSFLGENPVTFTVVGGIAVFVIVLLLMVTLNT
ncbi:hypothetical protein ELG79_36535 [Rhizobium leguminosarum]|uniref:hypothetical protein n=1 Tax=Rhizobium leguminosarum TaxID=384 RepID=UPI00102FF8A2|nr:hypothetical protein [Rhizobium leguminosarum]TBG08431.1 hypothetical protein ELG79_36535 [Rhizobium leguminosarum]